MPTPAEVRDQLTDILVAVVAVDPAAVTDDARLRDLGVDSLSAVEVADELGRRFGVHLPDRTVDQVVTVRDAVRAVLDQRPAPVREEAGFLARSNAFWRLALWFTLAGLLVGGLLGFAGAALVRATGIGGVDLPPMAAPTSASPSPTAEPTTTPTTPSPTPTVDDEPSFSLESDRVAPGQRFGLSGRFPELDEGEVLQVEVRDPGGEWDEFPVSVQTDEGGSFETKIYTSRTGEREFRMTHPGSGVSTPAQKVMIG